MDDSLTGGDMWKTGRVADKQPSAGHLLIFLPTYNERDNVTAVVRGIKATAPFADILFIDDHSPDGTGAVLDDLARQDPAVSVIHRDARQGIGSAHKQAIDFAYARGYKRLITMDADLTHSPEKIPTLLDSSHDIDMVVASRFLPAAVDGRSRREQRMSRWGHWLTAIVLKLPYDMTNAYRLYRLDRIDPLLFSYIQSDGYAFFFEGMSIFHQHGLSIKEVPGHLDGRSTGASKKGFQDALVWGTQLIMLRFRHQFNEFTAGRNFRRSPES